MTFQQLWATLKKRNPRLEVDTNMIEIAVEQFRKALRQSYEQGESAAKNASGDAADVFAGLFGR